MRTLTGTGVPVLPLPCASCTGPSGLDASFQPASPHCHVYNSSKRNLRLRLPSNRRRQDGKNRVMASGGDENKDSPSFNSTTKTSDSEKDVLAAKLAAAEAEAEALKRELAARRGGSREVDLAKLKIPTPEKRIDGTGYREQLFSGPGARKEPKKWGITEAELFLSKGAPTEGSGLGGEAMEEGAEAIIRRRLLIGLGITAVAGGLALIKLPVSLNKPTKPLFFYLIYVLRLKDQLETLEGSASDAKLAGAQLKRIIGSREELKDNFLSAAALIDGADGDRTSQLAFDVFEYLNEADYSKYFENLGEPTGAQQVEFLKFSLQSIKAARLKIEEYLTLVPAESVQAAKMQLTQ
ncbi:unnamed protein product [Calypogeia fissa]